MYNVGCRAVKTGCLADRCWEGEMICPHPLKAYYGKGQKGLKRLSNELRGMPLRSKWIPSRPVPTQMRSNAGPAHPAEPYAASRCFLSSRQAGGQKLAEEGARHGGAVTASRLRASFLFLVWAARGALMQGLIGG